MDPRFARVLRPISAVTVVVFTLFATESWNFAFAAQAPSRHKPAAASHPKTSAGRFEENLRDVQKLIQDMDQDLSGGKDITLALEGLKAHKRNLESADVEIRSEFAETEKFLKEKKLPQVILDRQTKAVSDYDGNYKKLKGDLDAILSLDADRKDADKKKDRSRSEARLTDLKNRIRSVRDDLETKVKKPRHQPLDPNNLPHRAAKPTKRKPRLKKEEFTEFLPENKPVPASFNGDPPDVRLASHTPGTDLPTAADLAETVEVKFTTEVNELASSLDHNPVKIYNWVHNNIDFTPTWGSIQGANHCLLTKQCNAFDTSSLLIALLRTSGIPARYVMGTIEVPIDQFMNWVGGFTDANAALTFAASGGIPTTGLQQGGTIKAVRLEHVWVEGYVDYVPSRGAVNKQGDTWVPLDGSFKAYSSNPGIDIDSAISFDVGTFSAQLESSATINDEEGYVTGIDPDLLQSAYLEIRNQVADYINQTAPGSELSDIIGGRTIIGNDLKIMSLLRPYKVVLSVTPASEVPETFRHHLTIEIINPITNESLLSVTKSFPELVENTITINYGPASSNDSQFLESLVEGDNVPISIPGYLVQLKPEINIGSEVFNSGISVTMGSNQLLRIDCRDSDGQSIISESIIVSGEYSAIALNSSGIGKEELSKVNDTLNKGKVQIEGSNYEGLNHQNTAGTAFYATALTYLKELDTFMHTAEQIFKVKAARLPSHSRFFQQLDANYLFDIPISVSDDGLSMDADLLNSASLSLDGDPNDSFAFRMQLGIISSVLEDGIPNGLFSTPEKQVYGVSAIKALSIANDEGIPIYRIDQTNIGGVLPQLELDESVTDEIRNSVAAGLEVIISKTNVSLNEWHGVGYVIFDPITGSGTYRISGGLNGSRILIALGLALVIAFIIGMVVALAGGPLGWLALLGILVAAGRFIALYATNAELDCLVQYLVGAAKMFLGVGFFEGLAQIGKSFGVERGSRVLLKFISASRSGVLSFQPVALTVLGLTYVDCLVNAAGGF